MAVQERYFLYQFYRRGVFLGTLRDEVVSPFKYTQMMNNAGCTLEMEIARNPYEVQLAVDELITESGDTLITESGDTLTTEREEPIYGNETDRALIRNGNDVYVYEISSDYPTGKKVFSGYIKRYNANHGTDANLQCTVISYGVDMDNYLIQGNTTVDQSQTAQDTDGGLIEPVGDKGAGWNRYGQYFTVGASVTSISAIILKCRIVSAPAVFTLKLWNSHNDFFSGSPLGTVEVTVSNTVDEDITFAFSTPIPLASNQQYFFSIQAATASGAYVRYRNADVYAGGDGYNSNYGGGSGGGGWYPLYTSYPTAADLYFKTIYTSLATDTPFSSTDPATIAETIVDNFHNQGSVVAVSSVDLTGLSRSYTFKLNTVLEGVKKCLELSPANWYWYVDPADGAFYFKETASTATHKLILGRHITNLDLGVSIEDLKNIVYFSGGDVGGGVNLFMTDRNDDSLSDFPQGLARISDNRVTISGTADALMENFLDSNSEEDYLVQIKIPASVYDITLFKPGDTVGFGGFGNFVDFLILQIASIGREPELATLNVGVLRKRASAQIEAAQKQLLDLQTVDNPDTPS